MFIIIYYFKLTTRKLIKEFNVALELELLMTNDTFTKLFIEKYNFIKIFFSITYILNFRILKRCVLLLI